MEYQLSLKIELRLKWAKPKTLFTQVFLPISRLNSTYMDSTQRSGKEGDTPHRWARILGTAVAIATVTLPVFMVAYYSPSKSNAEPLPRENIVLPQVESDLE